MPWNIELSSSGCSALTDHVNGVKNTSAVNKGKFLFSSDQNLKGPENLIRVHLKMLMIVVP